ncbi:MAG: hypothetical protein ACON4Q_01325, partial [Candidatus Puniceispirillaceae bacterium]
AYHHIEGLFKRRKTPVEKERIIGGKAGHASRNLTREISPGKSHPGNLIQEIPLRKSHSGDLTQEISFRLTVKNA